MKVNIISRKLVKPCTPTPPNLNKYKISLRDELSPPININVILFYPPNPNPKQTILSQLQESLAKILPQFYPLAGRYIQKDHLVDCNDEGAEFVEAEATDIELIDLIAKSKDDQLNDLLSRQIYDVDKSTDPLLSIQITNLKSGELAIGISVSHRIFDASSLGTFIAAWSNANHPRMGNTVIAPTFDSPSLFPGKNLGNHIQRPRSRDPNIVVKRLLFNKEDITNLRSKSKPSNNGEGAFIGRVRLVTALIAKALIGVELAKYGESRTCFVSQPVSMRERTIPPLPKHSCGNLSVVSAVRCLAANETKEIGLRQLVAIIGDAIDNTIKDIAQMLSLGEDGDKITLDAMMKMREKAASGEASVLFFSDWSKFGFYEADFGWGKPIWAGIGSMPRQHATILIDNKEGDGIEAWVHLNQNDVPYFERYLQLAEMESEDY
ncbi:pelargonidin 3-o-(6-caffeoylglucoside) 5-o-(6-o-malonylglucoside) 4'''-malonyltransferase [Phtheirospermum japonicum]|uniref:Pelargonidin 3-o-(6-caffeoylglucoside) 5-o-(6-o-malonylglucoside) 4'''-malonyltransferase n=1 Tax=Phtheirospermum japonicum TaxID=374723 RepID=A0A830BDM9_9LAMI|nr:pelargonidin 3-o-(6-caffeoylglucoside) 5-o-(6-o-malonylglucoside) 4'''-malonyltransferase [Phtheirospermum japonicum]